MFDFRDQVVLVTGAGRGIGRAAALLFARHGADVVLVDRDAAAIESAASEISALGRQALAVPTDVRDPAACQTSIDQTRTTFRRLDVLVNCAGGSRGKPLEQVTLEDFDAMINLNLRSAWVLCMAALPLLRARGGAIVNISSMASLTAVSHSIPYGIAKAGLNNMTLALAGALKADRIRVNALALSAVKSEGFLKAMANLGIDPATVPAGEPKEIAWAILFLASRACPFMNGVTIPVTGGH